MERQKEKRKRRMITREFVTKEEWKEFTPVRKYLLPLVLLQGLVVIGMGNMDEVFILYHGILAVITAVLYTKKKGSMYVRKERIKAVKITRKGIEALMILILLLQSYDTLRYGVVMTQIQFKNTGYVTVTGITNGDFNSLGLYANEYNKKEDKVYQHIFEGWTYKSKVDITEKIKAEMNRK